MNETRQGGQPMTERKAGDMVRDTGTMQTLRWDGEQWQVVPDEDWVECDD